MTRIVFFIIILLSSCMVATSVFAAATDIYVFDTPKQSHRFHSLSNEFRCVVCQNESLAESNAPLAKDLRFQIYKMVKQNKSDDEIVGYLTDRYGDFVLFRPRFSGLTFLLWLGPFFMLLVALGRLYWLLVQRQKQYRATTYTFSKQERERIRHLLREY